MKHPPTLWVGFRKESSRFWLRKRVTLLDAAQFRKRGGFDILLSLRDYRHRKNVHAAQATK